MLIDHIGIAISDLNQSKQFYSKTLAPLNIELIAEDQGWVGYGKGEAAAFWFGPDETIQSPMHIAFSAETRQQVDDFYEAAMAAGAKCNGKPGIRAMYHADYYGAFVIDPDGHNIEAVCHTTE